MADSNTVDNSRKKSNGKPFTKGDPRINRKGRPKSFDALRELAQEISHEKAQNDGKPLVIGGHAVTVAEAIMRKWASSKDPRLQQAFIEVAYGKAMQRSELTGAEGGPLEMSNVQFYIPENGRGDNGN